MYIYIYTYIHTYISLRVHAINTGPYRVWVFMSTQSLIQTDGRLCCVSAAGASFRQCPALFRITRPGSGADWNVARILLTNAGAVELKKPKPYTLTQQQLENKHQHRQTSTPKICQWERKREHDRLNKTAFPSSSSCCGGPLTSRRTAAVQPDTLHNAGCESSRWQ